MRLLSLACFLLLGAWVTSTPAAQPPLAATVLDLQPGNWAGDALTQGGLDAAAPGEPASGDRACLVVSADRALGFPPELTQSITLDRDFSHYPFVTLELGYRASGMMTPQGQVCWDGHPVAQLNAQGAGDSLKSLTCIVDPRSLGLTTGTHQLKIAASDSSNSTDLFQLDSIRLASPAWLSQAGSPPKARYEILTLGNGNWEGDAASWGGPDAAAAADPDRRGVWLKGAATDYPARLDLPVLLQSDFSQTAACVTIAARWLAGSPTTSATLAVPAGAIYWDDALLARCQPATSADEVPLAGNAFTLQQVEIAAGALDLAPGRHNLRFELEPASAAGSWQIDSLTIDERPAAATAARPFDLAACQWIAPTLQAGPQTLALEHLFSKIEALGGTRPRLIAESERVPGRPLIRLGSSRTDATLRRHFKAAGTLKQANALHDYQRDECYLMDLLPAAPTGAETVAPELLVAAPGEMGLVYALSELELRLRLHEGRLGLALPEFAGADPRPLLEAPTLRIRGEYLNVGYNIPQVTPHDWTRERWHAYIDQLVLARINRFYFFLWVSDFSMVPDSADSQNPRNRKLHEDLRDAIDYCHARGLKVTYMVTPAFIPRDIFARHPQIRADIEYADWGYPSVCSNAPGAWEVMRQVWRSEMAWFAKADAIHLWYYDPGGCMCEKYGCRAHQAEVLERQTREFAALFRTFNPAAEVEYNLWPIEHFEATRNMHYREDLSRRLKRAFGRGGITAVGSCDSTPTLPLFEERQKMPTAAFLFTANPENAYAFLIPNLSLFERTTRQVREAGVDGILGHRLEAWTRYPATFFMGQYLWNPDADRYAVVRKYADWQSAGGPAGAELAQALLLLDDFTQQGASAATGQRMAALTDHCFASLPTVHQRELEHLPAMMQALALLGASMNTDDNAVLLALRERYGDTLAASQTFGPSRAMLGELFLKYRTFLANGWAKQPF